MVIAVMLSLLVFIGEAVRDAFDPRKLFAGEAAPPESAAGGAPDPAPTVRAATREGSA